MVLFVQKNVTFITIDIYLKSSYTQVVCFFVALKFRLFMSNRMNYILFF